MESYFQRFLNFLILHGTCLLGGWTFLVLLFLFQFKFWLVRLFFYRHFVWTICTQLNSVFLPLFLSRLYLAAVQINSVILEAKIFGTFIYKLTRLYPFPALKTLSYWYLYNVLYSITLLHTQITGHTQSQSIIILLLHAEDYGSKDSHRWHLVGHYTHGCLHCINPVCSSCLHW